MTAAQEGSGTVRSGVFRFDPAHPLFADHFPGASVAPGSCIVQAFADEASRWAHESTRGDGGAPAGRQAGRQPAPLATPLAVSAGVPPHSAMHGHDANAGRNGERGEGDHETRPFPFSGPPRAVRGFRFRRFVTPGDYTFRMECTDDGLRCSLHALEDATAAARSGAAQSAPLVTGVLAW
ncbi:hypothetical protein DA2_1129 [Desulfovibrio sp. A2]|nr:hypothetical protein DA2_1129 [Desulfovibrio sp. A2]